MYIHVHVLFPGDRPEANLVASSQPPQHIVITLYIWNGLINSLIIYKRACSVWERVANWTHVKNNK